MRSGATFQLSIANHSPQRPKPDITSSAMNTIPNSSQIKIYYYSHGILTGYEVQYFNPKQLSGHLQYHHLTSEDLKQQGEFEQQQQEREDALEKAHDSSPQTCGGIDKCKHCQDERSYDETSAHLHLGGYT